MSGMFGMVRLDQRLVCVDDFLPLTRTLKHRGPDGGNFWLDGSTGIGHLKNSTTPESLQEQLPWFDSASGLCITADARLDNREELRIALGIDMSTAATLPDSQYILAAYRKWQRDCVDHLLGDFAFAIWDTRARSLFMARDHMGLRPFYYYLGPQLFAFASSALAVSRVEGVPARIDEGRVADFIVGELEGINNTVSFFKHIQRLPPAHCGWLEDGRLTVHRYWQLDPTRNLQLGSDGAYTDAFEEVLSQAIAARLRSDRPVAAMLSGGADSSTVTGISRNMYQQAGLDPFTACSAVSDDESGCIESRYIRMMLNHPGLNALLLRPADIHRRWQALEDAKDHLEDPFDASNAMLHLLYLLARENGYAVVLDGVDGDMVAGITTVYVSYLIRQGDWASARQEIRQRRLNGMHGKTHWLRAHWQAFQPALTPDFIRHTKHRVLESNWNRRALFAGLLSRNFVKRTNLAERWKEYMEQSTRGFCKTLRHAHAEALAVPYLTAAIERYTRTAAYYGVEARQPFQDKRVVEFCLSLPWQQKVRNGTFKYGLRTVLERYAPAELAWRNQFDSIMWKFSEQRDLREKQDNLQTLASQRERLLGFLDPEAFRQMQNGVAVNDNSALATMSQLTTLIHWIDRSGAESSL